jgi:hypothetical protein
MTHDEILQEITSLPLEGQRQVIDFIAFVRQRYGQPQQSSEHNTSDLSTESFIGIWQDRNDLKDSSTWVRNTREAEWTKESGTHHC